MITLSRLIRRPSAILPIAMSLGALALIPIHIACCGTAPQADEGTSAHLFQLLLAAQLPIIGCFAIRWLPESPRQALLILGLQLLAILAAFAPVFLLGW